ncbi:hypothetical protein [Glaciimonas immobilis]|uniref:DUF11 domain-containing protein n=1 Tax=Glaciimonas immobilis TaxID=728004 RepID=A0A840RNL7_9BURK|nr:hypothetical protein [Glaciimonas immobilis]KAF3997089.1 hypothetical protein HAV38_15605 [Glaciimonas immobilis]MBB5199947.1 hypothetical protein [Glaciimonas immobilis]
MSLTTGSIEARKFSRWTRAVAWTLAAVLLGGAMAPVFAQTISRQLPGGTELGTKATATYMLPTGLTKIVDSNVVITTIQNVYSLTLEGETIIGGTNKFHNVIRNTGNVVIKDVAIRIADLKNASGYRLNTHDDTEITLTNASPVVTFRLPNGGIKPGEILSLDGTLVQDKSDAVSSVMLSVEGPDGTGAELAQEYHPDIASFKASPLDNKAVELARDGASGSLVYVLDIKPSGDSSMFIGMDVDLTTDALKGLSLDPSDYKVDVWYGGGAWTPVVTGAPVAWGSYTAKLTTTDDKHFFLAFEFPGGASNTIAQLRIKLHADSAATLGVKNFQATVGKIDGLNATIITSASVKTPVLPVDITGIVQRDLALLPLGESNIAVVPGQIAKLRAEIENKGESEDTFDLTFEDTGLPAGTKLAWNTGNQESKTPAITLAPGKKQSIELQVQLAPFAEDQQNALLLAAAANINIKATPRDNTDETLVKTLPYTLTVGERTVDFVGIAGDKEDKIVHRVVDTDAAVTNFKLRVKNTTTTPSQERYTVSVKDAGGVDVSLYLAAVDGTCGPNPGNFKFLDTGFLSQGEVKNMCAQVSGSGNNGGIGNRTKVGVMLEVASVIAPTGQATAELPLNLYVAQIEASADKAPVQVIAPTGVISFYHDILNTSDIQLTINTSDLEVDMTDGWLADASLVSIDGKPLAKVTLGSKEKARIKLTIKAPADVPTTETPSLLTVSGTFQYTTEPRELDKFTYKLMGIFDGILIKEQALDAACNAAPADDMFKRNGISAKPGACIWYRLTLENKSGVDYAELGITDKAPSLSTISNEPANKPALSLISGGVSSPQSDPAVAGDTVEGKLNALKNTEKAVLKYRVKIDGIGL